MSPALACAAVPHEEGTLHAMSSRLPEPRSAGSCYGWARRGASSGATSYGPVSAYNAQMGLARRRVLGLAVGLPQRSFLVRVFGMRPIDGDTAVRRTGVRWVGAGGAVGGHKPDRHKDKMRVLVRCDRMGRCRRWSRGIERVGDGIDRAEYRISLAAAQIAARREEKCRVPRSNQTSSLPPIGTVATTAPSSLLLSLVMSMMTDWVLLLNAALQPISAWWRGPSVRPAGLQLLTRKVCVTFIVLGSMTETPPTVGSLPTCGTDT